MNTYLAVFIISTLSAVVLTPLVRRACERFGWLDAPGERRRVHRFAVPRLGGVAVFASFMLALSALALVENAVAKEVGEDLWRLAATLAPATLVFIFGVYDDLRGARARDKFLTLALAASIFYLLGGRVSVLSVPFVGTVELPLAVSFIVTVVWIVAVANAFNLIDGIDGLAAGAGLFASLVMLVVSVMLGHTLVAVAACALCGAMVGFLRYNFNPASIFLGDSGALFVGFTLAALSVHGAQKASTAVAVAIPLLAFGVPLVDTGFTLMRRFVSGRPLFQGDREHIHHMLLARGWSQRRVTTVLYGACSLFGLAALFFVHEAGRMTGLLLFIVAAAVALAVGRLRYHEVDELKAGVRRGLVERRLRTANNVSVRRAVRAMSEAKDLPAFFDAMRELLEMGEFVHARVKLAASDKETNAQRASQIVRASLKASPQMRGVKTEGGAIIWSWERGDIEPQEIYASERFWTLRLPLATERGTWGYVEMFRGLDADALLLDINYLCQLFQNETARAAERLFLSAKGKESKEKSAKAGSAEEESAEEGSIVAALQAKEAGV